jgi:hypothetical protein
VKKKLNMLTVLVFMALMGSTAAIAGIFVTVPMIPRTRKAMNRPVSNPLRDSVRVGCSLLDLIWIFRVNAEVANTCPGFNVESKIRWDWLGGRMSTVMSSRQTDGDQRSLRTRVLVTSCNSPNGVFSDMVVLNTPCQSPGGFGAEFYAVDPTTNRTQGDCETAGWSFTSGGECKPNESACVEAGGSWNFTTSTCGPNQSDCQEEGGSWNSFTNTCSGFPSPSPTPTPTTDEECDQAELFWNFFNSTCNTTPQECPGFCDEAGGIDMDLCHYEFGCPVGFSGGGLRSEQCCFPPPPCPVLIDVDGNGFRLTNATNGVNFDIDGDGDLDPISWTSGSSTNAWLILDRNGNGVVDNGRELFGNVSPQTVPRGAETNGFLALAEYDRPAKGGNGDGQISSVDAIFSSLKLWRDQNHNGISESNELHSLDTWGVSAFELDYKESKRTDDAGNQFRYRAKVKNGQGRQLGRWAWDVFLLQR